MYQLHRVYWTKFVELSLNRTRFRVTFGVLRYWLIVCFVLSSLTLGSLAGAQAAIKLVATQPNKMPPPLLHPQARTLAQAYNCIPAGSSREYCAEIYLRMHWTGIEWLDLALLQRFLPGDHLVRSSSAELLDLLYQGAEGWVSERSLEIRQAVAAAEPYFAAFDYQHQVQFISQNYHLASFKEYVYNFSGGAHGSHSTSYLVFDLQQQRQLKLAELFLNSDLQPLLALLEVRYRQEHPELAASWFRNPQEMQATLLGGSFFLARQGLELVYPPYALGPYSEGEITLLLTYEQLEAILLPEYQLGL